LYPADPRRCHDLTVPYPTASISLHDPFLEADLHGIHIEVDHRHIVQSWRRIPPGTNSTSHAEPHPHSHLQSNTSAGVPLDPGGESVDVLDDGEVRVVVSTTRKIVRKRPSAPPIFMLPLPYPFSHVSGSTGPVASWLRNSECRRLSTAEVVARGRGRVLTIPVPVSAAPVPRTHFYPLRVSLSLLPSTHRITIPRLSLLIPSPSQRLYSHLAHLPVVRIITCSPVSIRGLPTDLVPRSRGKRTRIHHEALEKVPLLADSPECE
jgi:hypothetical protein